MAIEGLLQIERYILSPLSAPQGRGVLMDFQLHPDLGKHPSVKIALTIEQAADLAAHLNEMIAAAIRGNKPIVLQPAAALPSQKIQHP